MDTCAKCGTTVEAGSTRCASCDASLATPGGLRQVAGWVIFFASTIPLTVGAIAAKQENYIPLGVGAAVLITGIVMIATGRSIAASAPKPIKQSADVGAAQSGPAQAAPVQASS